MATLIVALGERSIPTFPQWLHADGAQNGRSDFVISPKLMKNYNFKQNFSIFSNF